MYFHIHCHLGLATWVYVGNDRKRRKVPQDGCACNTTSAVSCTWNGDSIGPTQNSTNRNIKLVTVSRSKAIYITSHSYYKHPDKQPSDWSPSTPIVQCQTHTWNNNSKTILDLRGLCSKLNTIKNPPEQWHEEYVQASWGPADRRWGRRGEDAEERLPAMATAVKASMEENCHRLRLKTVCSADIPGKLRWRVLEAPAGGSGALFTRDDNLGGNFGFPVLVRCLQNGV